MNQLLRGIPDGACLLGFLISVSDDRPLAAGYFLVAFVIAVALYIKQARTGAA